VPDQYPAAAGLCVLPGQTFLSILQNTFHPAFMLVDWMDISDAGMKMFVIVPAEIFFKIIGANHN